MNMNLLNTHDVQTDPHHEVMSSFQNLPAPTPEDHSPHRPALQRGRVSHCPRGEILIAIAPKQVPIAAK